MRATFCTALLAVSLLLASCSDDPVGTPGGVPATYTDASLELYSSGVGSIGGRSAQDFYASGNIFAHYDGESWDLLEWPNAAVNYGGFDAIWVDPDNVINGLQYRRLFRYDGESWTSVNFPNNIRFETTTPCDDGVTFVIDYDNHVHKLEGTTWSEVDSLTVFAVDFFALTGTSAADLLAIGNRGDVAHFDGDNWTLTRPGEARYYSSAWKDPSGPLYMVGSFDSLFAFDGTSTTYIDLGGGFRCDNVWGNAPGQVFVMGRWGGQSCYSLRKREGNTWPVVDCIQQGGYSTWTAPTGESFIGTANRLTRLVGDDHEVILGETSDFRQGDYFNDIWGNDTDGYFVVGNRAFRYFNGVWTDLDKQALTVNQAISVWGTSAHDIWAVGGEMILHYDGKDWTWVSGANQKRMLSVWCNDRDVFAVGYDGTIMHNGGSGWDVMESGTTYNLSAVWGWDTGAFAAGESGVILRYDGRRWRIEDSPITWYIYDLFGLAKDDIWAVGSSSVEICHYDGRTWLPVDVPPLQGDCYSVWASSDRNVFVAHSSGRLLHYDGGAWAVLPRYLTDPSCVWGAPSGDVFLSGAGLIRYRR